METRFLSEPLKIVVDTREQAPFSFPVEKVIACRGTLKTGDYALEGDDGFAIERKSLNDFLGCISTDWDRFQREIERMKDFPACVILIESDFHNCCFRQETDSGPIIEPGHNHPQLMPAFICKRIAELTMMGVACMFASDAGQAAALCYQILKVRRERLENGINQTIP